MLDSRDMFAPGRKVLLLTYTRNLADELQRHLRSICSPQEFRAIEVKNIDRWVWGFLTGSDVSRGKRLFGRNGLGFETLIGREDDLWRRAMARRPASSGMRTTSELERARGTRSYASVVVDEVQDLGYQALRLIRAMVPKGKNDLMLVGDPHQRLYPGPRVVLERCGIRIRGTSSIRLTTCYRTPEAIRRWAAGIMDGQPIDGPDDATVSDPEIDRSAVAFGAAPVVRHMAGRQQHDDQVVRLVQSIAAGSQPHEGVCIVARHNAILARMQGALASAGISVGHLDPARHRWGREGVRSGLLPCTGSRGWNSISS